MTTNGMTKKQHGSSVNVTPSMLGTAGVVEDSIESWGFDASMTAGWVDHLLTLLRLNSNDRLLPSLMPRHDIETAGSDQSLCHWVYQQMGCPSGHDDVLVYLTDQLHHQLTHEACQ